MKKQEPPEQFLFEWGWWASDLGKYRPSRFAYSHYPYESLPPVDETQLTGKLEWLGPLEEEGQNEWTARLGKLIAQAQQLGLKLPKAFLRLMASPELQGRIPSCTGCYFDLSEQIRPCPGSKDGFIIRFLNDSQDVVLWHLYLTPQGKECVLAAVYRLEEQEDPDYIENFTEEKLKAYGAETIVCAPSFEVFLYRFWLENTIWFSLHLGKPPLTEMQRRYLAHYEQGHEQNVSG